MVMWKDKEFRAAAVANDTRPQSLSVDSGALLLALVLCLAVGFGLGCLVGGGL